MVDKNRIVILAFHPLIHKSRITRALLKAVEGTEGITIRMMYDLYPDFQVDVKQEQEVLMQHEIIVWQHPLYWYSCPSLLKEWLDLVLEHGVAYGREGRLLEGKRVMSAISTGGRKETYGSEVGVRFTIRQLLAPFEQTVRLCRMQYLPPFVTHGTHLLQAEQISRAAQEYRRALELLRDGALPERELEQKEYMNELIS